MVKLKLPDNSIIYFDEYSFKFSKTPHESNPDLNYTEKYDENKALSNFQTPDKQFSDCFRRIGEGPRYSSVKKHYEFDLTFLDDFYELKHLTGYGGMFSSSYREVQVLDGSIMTYQGYGFGNRSWTALSGFKVLRATCMFFGIIQPRLIKGEVEKRTLACILEELSQYKIKHNAFNRWNNPWKKNYNS
jgi:hypothetical protein